MRYGPADSDYQMLVSVANFGCTGSTDYTDLHIMGMSVTFSYHLLLYIICHCAMWKLLHEKYKIPITR